jgi:signal transduction histidine kinase
VSVVLRPTESGLHFEVADDGEGFDLAATAAGARIAERLSALGARLSVESAPGRGTRLTAEIPLEPG